MTDEQTHSLRLLRFMLETNRLHGAWNYDDRLGHGVLESVEPSTMGEFSAFITARGGLLFETMYGEEEFQESEINSPFYFKLWPKTIHERLAMIARINTLIGDRIDDTSDSLRT